MKTHLIKTLAVVLPLGLALSGCFATKSEEMTPVPMQQETMTAPSPAMQDSMQDEGMMKDETMEKGMPSHMESMEKETMDHGMEMTP